MCEMYSFPVVYSGDEVTEDHSAWNSQETIEDKVILETEITLRTGPNITMKIHEESRPNSVVSGTFESEEDSKKQGVIKVLNDDSESDFFDEVRKSPKTPRKVRFGGESFKLRTPESDSSHQANDNDNDDDDNEISTIKITLTDAVSITTRKSLIPVRIVSLPSSPKRTLHSQKSSKRHHQSAPNLTGGSKIPLRKKSAHEKSVEDLNTNSDKVVFYNITSTDQSEKEPQQRPTAKEKFHKESTTLTKPKVIVTKYGRANDVLSPIPVHNEIELFHNLTRSPERTRTASPVLKHSQTEESNANENKEPLLDKDASTNKNNLIVPYPIELENTTETSRKEESKVANNVKVYDSFTVCKDGSLEGSKEMDDRNESSGVIEKAVENDKIIGDNAKKPSLQQSLSSLSSEDDLWAKSEALESLVKMLKQLGTCDSLEPGAATLLFEALFACHHRDKLHSLTDDALTTLIEGLRPEVLEQCISRVALALCKMGASSGVRLALAVMKKLPPKKLQQEVLNRGFGHRTREGSLQILMTCARLYPKSDVEVDKIAQFASAALTDRRRRVRHAALETLAAVAQLSSVTETLNTVSDTIREHFDYEEIFQVVRTRLSRKQLPTVDLDGSVRYSSPTEQIETDWISGSMPRTNYVSPSPSSSATSSTPSINYWIHNSRHDNTFNNGSTLIQPLNNFQENALEESGKVWIPESSSSFPGRGKIPKGSRSGVLRPVYILQPEVPSTSIGRGYRKYDRGRSFSPPKYQRSQYNINKLDSSSVYNVNNNGYGDYHHDKNFDQHPRLQFPEGGSFRQFGAFKKSLSSDQIYSGEKLPIKNDQPCSYSLSSRSSSTSTGSSTRSNFWQKDFRSGIPVPVSEGKLKIRHSTSSSLLPSGPLIAKR